MRFIDLFAGLGGFHLALSQLGHECVFASEKNPELINLYKENFSMDIAGDIHKVNVEKEIPSHDILCAGFPCQPFSKAGKRRGLHDIRNGNFFDKIMEIVNFHKPEYILLENVPNLLTHDDEKTWKYIQENLSVNYEIDKKIMSPHQFGIPHHRLRIYIVCRLRDNGGLNHFRFPEPNPINGLSINSIIEENPEKAILLKEDTNHQFAIWQEFLNNVPQNEVPSFPIWAMEFGANYPFENIAPAHLPIEELIKYKGTFGEKICGIDKKSVLDKLPIYARTDKDREFPHWKKKYIRQNRLFYFKHKDWLDLWIPKILNWENSHQKFEWNCGREGALTINDKIVQIRPSGIRVKLPTYSPALVLTTTQIPIFPWLDRYMTIKEAARLQGMEGLKKYPETLKSFGNAVNVIVIKNIAQNLII
jgi:DNA (cytosine-5)-methyltransferase 1